MTVGDFNAFRGLPNDLHDEVKHKMIINGLIESGISNIEPYIKGNANSISKLAYITIDENELNISGREPNLTDIEQVLQQMDDVTYDSIHMGEYFEVRIMKQNAWAIYYTYYYSHFFSDREYPPHLAGSGDIQLLSQVMEKLAVICGPLFAHIASQIRLFPC